jgi:hypothetical protein
VQNFTGCGPEIVEWFQKLQREYPLDKYTLKVICSENPFVAKSKVRNGILEVHVPSSNSLSTEVLKYLVAHEYFHGYLGEKVSDYFIEARYRIKSGARNRVYYIIKMLSIGRDAVINLYLLENVEEVSEGWRRLVYSIVPAAILFEDDVLLSYTEANLVASYAIMKALNRSYEFLEPLMKTIRKKWPLVDRYIEWFMDSYKNGDLVKASIDIIYPFLGREYLYVELVDEKPPYVEVGVYRKAT